MIVSQAQNEVNEFIENFDTDFFDFIREYESLIGKVDITIEDNDAIEDYIQNIKIFIQDFE